MPRGLRVRKALDHADHGISGHLLSPYLFPVFFFFTLSFPPLSSSRFLPFFNLTLPIPSPSFLLTLTVFPVTSSPLIRHHGKRSLVAGRTEIRKRKCRQLRVEGLQCSSRGLHWVRFPHNPLGVIEN